MQKRESKEFKEFFERFFIPVCHFIKRYTEEEEVADIAQEVFVKVYEKWNEFDSLGNAKAFLYIAARNLCLDFIKHKKAEANYLSEYMHGEEADDPVFLKEVTRQETFRILHTAIDKLPAQRADYYAEYGRAQQCRSRRKTRYLREYRQNIEKECLCRIAAGSFEGISAFIICYLT